MSYTENYNRFASLFKLGKNMDIEGTDISIRFFPFDSNMSGAEVVNSETDILENFSFEYPVFVPAKKKKFNKAILLLHGLNERSWNKYLTWAEYLCRTTERPVILFPIAYHINRAPFSWSNPRNLMELLSFRRKKNGNDRSITFANLALSKRLSENPYRFYNSGRETMFDLITLFNRIKSGSHPLFEKNTEINIFSYSIGSFLAQITSMANINGLFSDSKIFMFCGGSIFSEMNGVSRGIMDKEAFTQLHHFYVNQFKNDYSAHFLSDEGFRSFNSMISPERDKEQRIRFFSNNSNRIKSILLKNDIVIPYNGVVEAVGDEFVKSSTKLWDFPFSYTHENPFPVGNLSIQNNVDTAFENVFSEAAQFLAS